MPLGAPLGRIVWNFSWTIGKHRWRCDVVEFLRGDRNDALMSLRLFSLEVAHGPNDHLETQLAKFVGAGKTRQSCAHNDHSWPPLGRANKRRGANATAAAAARKFRRFIITSSLSLAFWKRSSFQHDLSDLRVWRLQMIASRVGEDEGLH